MRAVTLIKKHIARGSVYQVNFTMKRKLIFHGDPFGLYTFLRKRQPVSYGACIQAGAFSITSVSPELFFEKKGRTLIVRPMKGTAPRGLYAREDRSIAQQLASDEKNRAENIMIVDLMRNDLARVCVPGTIKAAPLFDVEKHPTLFQMTSTVKGTLLRSVQFKDIIAHLFPSGSITGAPKKAAMNMIAHLEKGYRGVYSGTIGCLAPSGDAVFSVAIRTVQMMKKHAGVFQGDIGVGGGITWGSDPGSEYDEALLKGRFLGRPAGMFNIIETMLYEHGRFFLLDLHCERLQRTADHFGYPVDMCAVLQKLQAAVADLPRDKCYRVRLLLSESGDVVVSSAGFSPGRSSSRVLVSRKRTDSMSLFLQYKTTHRVRYEQEYQRAVKKGFDDILFFNECGELTEGAISNVILELGGRLYTPPRRCGLLAGVYREHLLAQGRVTEKVLNRADLFRAETVYLCNAVRKRWVVKPYIA